MSVRPSVFKYLRDRSLYFLIFCMKLGYHKGTKWQSPNFEKNSWGSQMGDFWCFCPYFCIQSSKVSEMSHTLQAQHYVTPFENRMSRKIWFWLYSKNQIPIFETLSFFAFFCVCHIMWVVMQKSEWLKIWTVCTLSIVTWRSIMIFSKNLSWEGLIRIITHNLCVYNFFYLF